MSAFIFGFILLMLFKPECAFNTQLIPVINRPDDPLFVDFHMTRYAGGCLHDNEQQYDTIIPWMRNFDVIVTSCGVDWRGGHSGNSPCVYEFNPNDPKRRKADFNETNGLIRVHVKSDPPYNLYFAVHMLPEYEKRYKETGQQILLHSGGGDNSVGPDYFGIFMNSSAILRYVVENNRLDEYVNNPKMVQLPIGICPRETYSQTGLDLRTVMNETDIYSSHKQALILLSPEYRAKHEHRLLKMIDHSQTIKWSDRKDRIYFCFNSGGHRGEIIEYLKGNCTFCDFCNNTEGYLSHLDLWHQYAQYKFVFSPWGNGYDCGRTWEILLLGAVPLIHYFPGALGYEQGGLHAITVKNYTDVTKQSLDLWLRKYTEGTDVYKLSREFWEHRAFGNLKGKHS